MTAQTRSIWLMPTAEDGAFFEEVVAELARRFGTPVFAPHLTLRGDTAVSDRQLADDARAIARAVRAFTAPIAAVEMTNAYFRAFFARFDVSGELATLKRALDPAGAASFVPHVSLLYGELPASTKAAAVAEVNSALSGRPIGFDRIAIVRSGQDVPIADWSIVETVPLGA